MRTVTDTLAESPKELCDTWKGVKTQTGFPELFVVTVLRKKKATLTAGGSGRREDFTHATLTDGSLGEPGRLTYAAMEMLATEMGLTSFTSRAFCSASFLLAASSCSSSSCRGRWRHVASPRGTAVSPKSRLLARRDTLVSSCALARLSTAIAKKTLSSVSAVRRWSSGGNAGVRCEKRRKNRQKKNLHLLNHWIKIKCSVFNYAKSTLRHLGVWFCTLQAKIDCFNQLFD